MNSASHCTIKIHEFAAFEGWYWDITVPREIHPKERIREFVLDDPGLGCAIKLEPIGSVIPQNMLCMNCTYTGVIKNANIACMIKSSLIALDTNRIAKPLLSFNGE